MREVEVLRDGRWQWIQWRAIAVGDVVKVVSLIFVKIIDVAIIAIDYIPFARTAFLNMHRFTTTLSSPLT